MLLDFTIDDKQKVCFKIENKVRLVFKFLRLWDHPFMKRTSYEWRVVAVLKFLKRFYTLNLFWIQDQTKNFVI